MRIIAILGLITACATTHVPTEQEFLTAHRSSLVVTPKGSGTGFAISETEVMTAWHVIQSATSLRVDGRPASSWKQIGNHDAGIITFEQPHGLTVWKLRNHDATAAERVYLSGWGVGKHWWSSGIATGDADRLSCPICPGDSGAPIYDRTGAVVGIAVSRGRYAEHHCGIVPISRLLPAIKAPA
tara:strand:+ start:1258 stop:1809 length:552 start_codon:yes stop_codon:yes gene_type:complete